MKRRDFIQKSAGFAAGTMFTGLGTSKLFGLTNSSRYGTMAAIETVTLNNGVKMPILGFGTLYLNDDLGVKCVSEAISLGYRLIDTAKVYENEEAVGAGIKKSGINREELFVTSKIWVDDYGYETGKKAFQTALDKLGLDYLDLYLLHEDHSGRQSDRNACLLPAGKGKPIIEATRNTNGSLVSFGSGA
jgi:2,5-diketo-D-gluconate reductase A